METLQFGVISDKEGIFKQRLSKLHGFCTLNDLKYKLIAEGVRTERFYLTDIDNNRRVLTKKITDYKLTCEKLVNRRYYFAGVVTGLDKSNSIEYILNKDNRFKDVNLPDSLYTADVLCGHCKSGRRCSKTLLFYDTQEDNFLQIARGCSTNYNFISEDTELKHLFSGLESLSEDTNGIKQTIVTDRSHYEFKKLVTTAFLVAEDTGEFVRLSNKTRLNGTASRLKVDELYRNFRSDGLIEDDKFNSFIDYYKGKLDDDRNLNSYITDDLILRKEAGLLIYNVFEYVCPKEVYDKKDKLVFKGYYGVPYSDDWYQDTLTMISRQEMETKYGWTNLYKFTTSSGKLLVWWTQVELSMTAGMKGDFRFKVANHDVYNGDEQTRIKYVSKVNKAKNK